MILVSQKISRKGQLHSESADQLSFGENESILVAPRLPARDAAEKGVQRDQSGHKLVDFALCKAFAHERASLRPGEMHVGAFCGPNKLADLLQAIRRQPALPSSALNRETIG